MMLVHMFFFFFQAEDGIRDYKVTGVQTCALPIFLRKFTDRSEYLIRKGAANKPRLLGHKVNCASAFERVAVTSQRPIERSEERRVGKECRSGRRTSHQKEKGDGQEGRRCSYHS